MNDHLNNKVVEETLAAQKNRLDLALNWTKLEYNGVDLIYPMAYGLLNALNQLVWQAEAVQDER